MKKLLNRLSNGIVLIIIGIMHTHYGVSSNGFPEQFNQFSNKWFFKISNGAAELPAAIGKTDFETFSAFWFFYFGILLFPLGLLIHSIEMNKKNLPHSFTISYLIVILIGCYMVPNSGMTIFMLPHAIYMLVSNYLKVRKNKKMEIV